MIRYVSLDMDGTLINMKFADKVWMEGVPALYAEKYDMAFEPAKKVVVGEYMKVLGQRLSQAGYGCTKDMVVGEYMKVDSDNPEWYDIEHWLDKFGLDATKEDLLEKYAGEVEIYPEVRDALDILSQKYDLVVTSNAPRYFLEMEMEEIGKYFSKIFSATSDFKQTKKNPQVYREVCRRLEAKPTEVMHIGDHYFYDYKVPLDAGMDALFLDRMGKRTGRWVVGNLRDAVEQIYHFSSTSQQQR
jgi:putative hydrolase of the HAD superfamily